MREILLTELVKYDISLVLRDPSNTEILKKAE
jgi:hypothetical protein